MSEVNLFEIASRNKFSFETAKRGYITVEQLWDIALTGTDSVDAIAIKLNDDLQKSSTKSFVTTSNPADKETQLKLELVKYIIGVRLAELAAKAAKAEKASKRKALNEAIAAKENEELLSGSVEELKKRRAELDD
jgi:hypothetical protein